MPLACHLFGSESIGHSEVFNIGFVFMIQVEVEVDDMNANPFNTMPPPLEKLHHATAFDKKWLMFLYRNFKQRCPSGRMGRSECRAIFRQFFPRAAHYAFADRLFQALTKQTGRSFITFEDLVLCLFDLTDGGSHENGDLSSANPTSNFIANIIGTDEKGRVTLDSWVGYASAIWGLRACRSAMAENAASLGLTHGNSVHASKSVSLHGDAEMAASRRLAPLFEKYARERFQEFDTDGDGFLSLDDIEREIQRLYGNQLTLHTKFEYANKLITYMLNIKKPTNISTFYATHSCIDKNYKLRDPSVS